MRDKRRRQAGAKEHDYHRHDCLGTVVGKCAPNALVFGVCARAFVAPSSALLASRLRVRSEERLLRQKSAKSKSQSCVSCGWDKAAQKGVQVRRAHAGRVVVQGLTCLVRGVVVCQFWTAQRLGVARRMVGAGGAMGLCSHRIVPTLVSCRHRFSCAICPGFNQGLIFVL